MEQLQNEKTRLEEESRMLDEELKQLETRSKILEEKVAIQELRNENASKKQVVRQLVSKLGMLETQLEKLTIGNTFKKEAIATSEKAENHEAATELTTASEEGRGQDDDIIRVVALDNEEEMRATVEVEKEKEKRFFY
jgi:transcription initiation factor IIF auxiliary subunit